MNKIATILLGLVLAVTSFAQNPQHQRNREMKQERRARESYRVPPMAQPRVEQPRVEQHRAEQPRFENRDRSRYEQHDRWNDRREHREFSGRRIIILPRIVFRFPYRYRGFYVYSAYDVGYRDGFYRGREDFRRGYPCDVNFVFDYRYSRNDQYREGFIKGYYDGCRF